MAIFGFILMICYVPGYTGFALLTGWLFLSATLPWILRERLLTMNYFLFYAAAGLSWTMIWQQGVFDVWKLALLSGAFILGQTRLDTTRLYVGMAAGLTISTVIGMGQWFGWHPTPSIYDAPSGLFFNPNVLGEIAVLITVACWASELWVWAALSIPAVLLSQSRTAILALGVVGVIWLWRRYTTVVPILLLVAGLAIPVAWANKPVADLTYRFAVWQNTISGLTLFGRGPGSYIITYPVFAAHTDSMSSREEDAHNDFLQLVYQYGIGTLLLLPLLLVAAIGPMGPERYLFFAFCIIAFFNFPLQVPVEGFLGAFAMGRLWRDRDLVWNKWLARRWAFARRMGLPQFGNGPKSQGALSLEPIHPN